MANTIYGHALTRPALPLAARTNAVVNGTTVDLGVFGNDFRTALFIITTGTITDGSHAVTLQDSADGTSWTAVPPSKRQGALPTIADGNNDTVFEFGYIVGSNRYVRLVVTTTGATDGGEFSAVAVLSGGSTAPAARA